MIINSQINKKILNGAGIKRYEFELSNFGFPHVDDIKQWVNEDPKNRSWGNMGFIHCNSDEDAIMVMLRWS